jgi:hypothetical protein
MIPVGDDTYFVLTGETDAGHGYVNVMGRVTGPATYAHEGAHRTIPVRPVGSRMEANLVKEALKGRGLEGHVNV